MHVANNLASRGAQTHSSFKRAAPVMGNRGLETRQSKRSQHGGRSDANTVAVTTGAMNQINPVAQPIQVGALEVMNVKRVVNRYGTLPKVQRIGQFLDSLEDSNEGNNVTNSANLVPQPAINGVHGRVAKNAPAALAAPLPQQMIRSNSSGGVTMQNNASASLNKLQRHRTTADGSSMLTFSSFRGNNSSNSPKRNQQPALANLEFPPPPLDLPPPPEEFENMPPPPPPQPECDLTSPQPFNAQLAIKAKTSCNDVSNTAPSVEEASSRFGVSLRKREPSTDSCSSLGTPAANDNNNGNSQNQELTMKEKLMAEIKDRQAKENGSASANIQNGNSNVDPVALLVNELAESMNLPKQKQLNANKSPAAANDLNSTSTTNSFKAQLKKVEPKKMAAPSQKPESQTNIIDFKAHLRKVETKTSNQETSAKDKDIKKDLESASTNASTTTANKSPLSNTKSLTNMSGSSTLNRKDEKKFSTTTHLTQKTEIKIDLQQQQQTLQMQNANNSDTATDANTTSNEPNMECGKRRSTGSINSLKKLWEQPGQTTGTGNQNQPDYASTQNLQGNANTNNISSSSTQLSPKFAFKPTTSGGLTTPTSGTVSLQLQQHQQQRYPHSSTQISPRIANTNSNKPPPLQPPPPPPPQNQHQHQQHSSHTTSNNSHNNTTTSTHLTNSISTQFTELNTVNNASHKTTTTSAAASAAAAGDDSQQQQQDNDLMMTQSMFVENTNTTAGLNNKLTTSSINSKPAVPLKPTKLTIYATPMAQKLATAGGNADITTTINNTNNTNTTTSENSTKISRESILELVGLLEGSLKHPVNTISASQWLQLSDKLNILQNSCVVFADNECMPPHSKFHFRELVTRVETQSQSLRTAGTKNVQDNERLITEVGQSLKQITNALHR